MKKYLAFSLLPLTFALTACGGGGDSGSNASSQTNPSNPSTPTTPTNPTTPATDNTLSKIVLSFVTMPAGGQTLKFTTTAPSVADITEAINDKKYYGRYAFCATFDDYQRCRDIRIGEVNFDFKKNGNEMSVSNLVVDKLGKVTFDNQNLPIYTPLSTGKIELSQSSLTLVDGSVKHYNLKLTPVNKADERLPTADVEVYFSEDGMHFGGVNRDYLLTAQQMKSAPVGWASPQDISKTVAGGVWNTYSTYPNLAISQKSTVNIATNDILQGASSLTTDTTVLYDNKKYNGYYKNLGEGFLFGYTKDNQPFTSTSDNYVGVQGLIITAPDNQFGVGYSWYEDEAFLAFR